MELLIACSQCERQYKSANLKVGQRFHCSCGHTITVKAAKAHDSNVIRCSNCGGNRSGQDDICSFCDSTFTIHEKDLNTICPKCLTRISRAAKYCHSCGLHINPSQVATQESDRQCPVCLDQAAPLRHRQLGNPPHNALECSKCAGLWIDHHTFNKMEHETFARILGTSAYGQKAGDIQRTGQKGPFYRQCPECQQHMNRKNYGNTSGFIIDICKDHGIWFDQHELNQILDWLMESNRGHRLKGPRQDPSASMKRKPQANQQVKTMSSTAIDIGLDEAEDLCSIVLELFDLL